MMFLQQRTHHLRCRAWNQLKQTQPGLYHTGQRWLLKLERPKVWCIDGVQAWCDWSFCLQSLGIWNYKHLSQTKHRSIFITHLIPYKCIFPFTPGKRCKFNICFALKAHMVCIFRSSDKNSFQVNIGLTFHILQRNSTKNTNIFTK